MHRENLSRLTISDVSQKSPCIAALEPALFVCVCVFVCVFVCVCARTCACVRACACVCRL